MQEAGASHGALGPLREAATLALRTLRPSDRSRQDGLWREGDVARPIMQSEPTGDLGIKAKADPKIQRAHGTFPAGKARKVSAKQFPEGERSKLEDGWGAPWTPASGRREPFGFSRRHIPRSSCRARRGLSQVCQRLSRDQRLPSEPRPSPCAPPDGASSNAKLGWSSKERRAVDSSGGKGQ